MTSPITRSESSAMTGPAGDRASCAGQRAGPRPLADAAEAALVAAARGGDEPAVRELIRRLNPRLFRVARGIVDSDAEAEDVLQETYLTGFTRLDQFRGASAFATWMTRIAINAARMRRRSARVEESYDTVTEDSPDSAAVLRFPGAAPDRPDVQLGRAQLRAMLEAAVAALPPDLRLPFLLREVDGMSVSSIAAELSLNPITVKTRLFRARRRLRLATEAQVRGGFDAIFPFDGARCANMAERVVAALKARGRL